jgi:hypothetical protein
MGLRFKLYLLPALLPDEKVLLFKKRVWLSSGKSYPSNRIFFSLPPLWEAGLYVTDRRLLFVVHLFRLVSQEWSIWFEGRNEPGDHEFVKGVNLGKSRLFGPYLEVISETPEKLWYRSSLATMKLFLKNPETISRIIDNLMTKIEKPV